MAEFPGVVQYEAPEIKQELIFFRFVRANKNLMHCYGRIPEEDLKGMSKGQMDTMCQSEKIEIKRILESNEMTTSRIVKDRIHVLEQIAHIPYTVYDDSLPKATPEYAFKK